MRKKRRKTAKVVRAKVAPKPASAEPHWTTQEEFLKSCEEFFQGNPNMLVFPSRDAD